MPAAKQLRNVTLVGGSGTVGAPILAALIAAGHKVTVLSRPESTATFPSTVTVHKGSYDDEAFLAPVLAGQDVLIMALSYNAYGAQVPLIKAAAAAGVPYVVPCEFGSDATHEALNRRVELMNEKRPFRALVEAEAEAQAQAQAQAGGASASTIAWIGVVTNPWFDFSLRRLGPAGFGLDLEARKATLFGEGRARANFTTLRRVGESLAALLALPGAELARHRNGWVYFSSFRVSQRDLLASAQRATGTREGDWEVRSVDPEEAIAAAQAEVARGNMMAGARVLFALLLTEGYGGDYEAKVVDYKRLGLEPEDLDEVVKGVVQELAA